MNPTNEPGLSLIDAIVYQAAGDNEVLAATIKSNIQAYTNIEIAKVLKTILKSYPKKNRTMNDTSKLTRADIDRMITELKERDDE